jgi:hypothetical protein
MGKRKGLFQHYFANHPSPFLNQLLRDLTRPGHVPGQPIPTEPVHPPFSREEYRSNQNAGGIVLFVVGAIVVPFMTVATVGFDLVRLGETIGGLQW